MELKGALSDNEKRLVGMGTKVLIWPDKMSFDTASGTLSALGSSWQQGGVTQPAGKAGQAGQGCSRVKNALCQNAQNRQARCIKYSQFQPETANDSAGRYKDCFVCLLHV